MAWFDQPVLRAGDAFEEGATKLRSLRATEKPDAQEVLEVLNMLAGVEKPTLAALSSSKVGVELNQACFRKHPDERIQAKAKELVTSWKEIAARDKKKQEEEAAQKKAKQDGAAEKEAKEAKVQEDAKKAEEPVAKKARKADKSEDKSSGKKEGDKAKKEKPKKEPKKAPVALQCAENAALVEAFEELASFEFKLSQELQDAKRKFAGATYKKVAGLLKEQKEKVTSGNQVKHLSGLGAQSQKKIDEFNNGGSIERLEKYRKGEWE
eukprot:TRINITY_DN121490_c0_g1_i1.p1 TRINITY_DN121490_c0_g1~~TRINITY_DN121490_c0_g1_i1.p1  ORF type:complete len:266 (+),score=95.62 TRINITY_DN121490_c0_g1_i1:57-854(+)